MKNLKFSLSNIEGKLTRQQMRNILGGSGPGSRVTCDTSVNENSCINGRKCFGNGRYICCLSGPDLNGDACAAAVERVLG